MAEKPMMSDDDAMDRLREVLAKHTNIVSFLSGTAKADANRTTETLLMALTEIDNLRSDLEAMRGLMIEFRSLSISLAHALVVTQNGEQVPDDFNPIGDYLRMMDGSDSSH
jgi:hypothetical protein